LLGFAGAVGAIAYIRRRWHRDNPKNSRNTGRRV
jgi:hypothetical protein